MQSTSACDDCLVTFVLDGVECADREHQRHPHDDSVTSPTTERVAEPLVLDEVEAVAVRRLVRAGLVPALRHEVEAVAVP